MRLEANRHERKRRNPGRGGSVENKRMKTFNFRLSSKEKAMLEDVASSYGLTAADVLRMHIRAMHAWLQSERGKPAWTEVEPHG
jgi:hypothetical protein